MALSALEDRALNPTADQLTRVLGPADDAWRHLVSRMDDRHGPLTVEWTFSGAKYGWSCRLRQKKRTILYLIPQDQAFLAGVVLGDRALAVLRRDDLSPGTRELIDQAPRYGEGTGFRIPVESKTDCANVEVVVAAKMS